MTSAWKFKCDTHTQKLVLMALADNANDQGVCWPSIDTLALKCDLSRQGVIDQIEKLEKVGVLRTQQKPGRSNVYFISIPDTRPVNPVDYASNMTPVNAVDYHQSTPLTTPVNAVDPNRKEPSSNRRVAPPENKKTELQLRVEKMFKKRSTTPWDKSELTAWRTAGPVVAAATEDELQALEAFYSAPQQETFARKTLATMLNNFSGELAKAIAWQQRNVPQVDARPLFMNRFNATNPPKRENFSNLSDSDFETILSEYEIWKAKK